MSNINGLERAQTVQLLAKSIEDSLKEYDSVSNPLSGYNIDRNDSKGSIITRCKAARHELLMITKEL